jgi:phosphoribosylamine--glycine ligase
MVSSMDHKRIGDNDTGLNTGGMGTVAPNPYYTKAVADECMETIFLPTINAMNAEGRTFKGCLYFGLMLTPNGPKVIEYNCRFGDPETQVVLPLLESDLLTVMQATTNGTLAETEVKFADKHACCVIMASAGYPTSYKKGFEMSFTEEALAATFVAGDKLEEGKLVTSGGRVTGTTVIANSLEEAIKEAYRLSDGVKFEGAYRRSDIGLKALMALR